MLNTPAILPADSISSDIAIPREWNSEQSKSLGEINNEKSPHDILTMKTYDNKHLPIIRIFFSISVFSAKPRIHIEVLPHIKLV